jgi:hypothetical protein
MADSASQVQARCHTPDSRNIHTFPTPLSASMLTADVTERISGRSVSS